MKKINLLLITCMMSFMAYSQGYITYQLNGGVTNPDGWKNKADMYQGLYQSWNTFKGGGQTAWTPIASLTTPLTQGIPTQAASMDLTFIANATVKAKWQWLIDYMDAFCEAEQPSYLPTILTKPSADAAFLRYNLSAFFCNGQRIGWPNTPNYAEAGKPEAFIPAWKHAFAGPDFYVGTVVIPDPYKEGATFNGWYTTSDFSGAKLPFVTGGSSYTGTSGNITLYAKWDTYVNTCKEVQDMAAGKSNTKTSGIVTFCSGTTAYIQDVSAGLMIEFGTNPVIAVGDNVIVTGTTAAAGSYIKLIGAVLDEKSTATLPVAVSVTVENVTANMFKYVSLEGLKIIESNTSNVKLTNGDNEVTLIVDGLSFSVGKKVNVKATVSATEQLIGYAANVTLAPLPMPDPATYPVMIVDGIHTLKSKWLVSNKLGNLSANRLGGGEMIRSMAAKNGKMYFPDKANNRLVVVDGETGERLPSITFTDIFTDASLPYNDIRKDAAGNLLLANLPTSKTTIFQIWKVDLEAQTGEAVIKEVVDDNFTGFEDGPRFDAFGVYGDVDKDAIIMAANAAGGTSFDVAKWTISNGTIIDRTRIATGVQYSLVPSFGVAPQVFIRDKNSFYVDGSYIGPVLFDMSGNIIERFYSASSSVNGLIEFRLGGEDFFLVANEAHSTSTPYSFKLFKLGKDKSLADMKALWVFPEAGTGSSMATYWAAVASVEVNDAAGEATIYIYAGENGYGAYTFTGKPVAVGLTQPDNELVSIFTEGRTIKLNKEVAQITVFSITGQQVAGAENTTSVKVPSNGIYIVKMLGNDGQTNIRKVIVK